MGNTETNLAWKIADVAAAEIHQWHVLHQLALESFNDDSYSDEVAIHQRYHDSAIAAANAISVLYSEILNDDDDELSSPFLSLIEYDDFVQDDFTNSLRQFIKSNAMLRHPAVRSPEDVDKVLVEMACHAHELCKRAHEILTR